MRFFDQTVKPGVPPEIEVEPNGDVELAFCSGGTTLTLILSPDEFQSVMARGRDLVAMGMVGRRDAEAGE